MHYNIRYTTTLLRYTVYYNKRNTNCHKQIINKLEIKGFIWQDEKKFKHLRDNNNENNKRKQIR